MFDHCMRSPQNEICVGCDNLKTPESRGHLCSLRRSERRRKLASEDGMQLKHDLCADNESLPGLDDSLRHLLFLRSVVIEKISQHIGVEKHTSPDVALLSSSLAPHLRDQC